MSEEDESKRNDATKLFTPCKCGKRRGGGNRTEVFDEARRLMRQTDVLQEVVKKLKSL